MHVYRGEGRDVAALAGVDLTVRAGEMIALLGPSGAGKSTLLSLLAGLFRPTAGTVLVGDLDLTSASQRELDTLHATDVSLMLQGAGRNLLPFLTAHQNIAFAQQAARAMATGEDRLPSAPTVLGMVGLADEADTPLAAPHTRAAAAGDPGGGALDRARPAARRRADQPAGPRGPGPGAGGAGQGQPRARHHRRGRHARP